MSDDKLTDREKARKILKTWSKRVLVERVLNTASEDRLGSWAWEHDQDEDRNRDSQAAP